MTVPSGPTGDGHSGACRDYGLTRRALLARAGAVGAGLTVTSMFGDVLSQAVYAADGRTTASNVLVVLSLRGGADGLSLVVPHADDAYYAARPGTSISKDSLLFANSTFGLHPSFAPLSAMWTSGQFAALHAVGLPAPNRSHFDAQLELEEATPGSQQRVGWLNRMIGGLAGDPLIEGVQMGDVTLPTSLQGPATSAIAVTSFKDTSLPWGDNADLGGRSKAALNAMYGNRGGSLGRAGRGAISLAAMAGDIGAAEEAGPQNGAAYPNGDLGTALHNTAALIRTAGGVRAVALDYGGWDHHTDLLRRMDDQVRELSSALAAFFADLGSAAGRVTVVTLSEFGRRLAENGASGVDHGYGQAVLVLGAGVKGGRFYSRWPGLDPKDQLDGDLAMSTDYRDVLTEILTARFPSVSIPTVFPRFSRAAKLGFVS